MKKYFILAAAALAFAACTSDELVPVEQVQQVVDDGAVRFDVYTQRGVTRAGVTGPLTTTELQTGTHKNAGFGVFGYYTNNSTYDQQYIPNFMYNEQVKYNGSSWTYEPLKYWPNEYGETAQSEDQDKITFFAYAPWVEVVPSTGKITADAEDAKWGINSLSRNNATGDPLVKYIVSFDQDKSVDLCWGVCDNTIWPAVVEGTQQNINNGELGLPWMNVERPSDATAQKMKFTFKHATAQLKVLVDAFVDGTDNTNAIAAHTKVYIRSISFEGLATKGALNLNNTEAGSNNAYWLDYNGTNDLITGESVTIYDGRKDGKEGTPSGIATNEKSLGLNPNLVQSTLWSDPAPKAGVTNVEQFLFSKGDGPATAPVYVIPTGDDMKVTIVYDIETADESLATYVSDLQQHGSSIENCISKEINFGNTKKLENGKSYVIKLHLGMNSVKFDAEVTDWVEADAIPDVDLPANVPQYASLASGATEKYEVILPATDTKYTFAITGLNGGEAISAPATSGNFAPDAAIAANSSGVAIESVTITPNMTPKDKEAVNLTWTGVASSRIANMSFIQKAHALELEVASVNIAEKELVLAAGATGIVWNSDVTAPTNVDADGIKVWRNGARLLHKATTDGDGQFKWDAADHKIVLYTAPVPGETYTVYVKAGNAAEETVTVHIGGALLSNASENIEFGETYQRKPVFYGPATPSYTWNSSETATATVDGAGIVTSVAVNSSTPANISVTTADIPTADGWVYDTSTKSYSVTVTKAAGTISFTDPAPANPAAFATYTSGTAIMTNVAVLKNSKGTTLTPSSANGTITYTLSDDTNFYISASGELRFKGAGWTANDSKSVTVTATVGATNDNADYAENTVSYSIIVTTQP